MKKYISKIEDLNEEEKRSGKISYRRLIERIGNIWLFNKAPELSGWDFEFVLNSDYNEKTDELIYIYQHYLIAIDDYTLELLQEKKCKDLIIAWSEKLGEYILCVTHFGTSWDYVMTEIEWTLDYNEADI